MKEQWKRLAVDLGFEFKHEIRPHVELPSLHKMAAHAVKKGDIERAEKLLKHPMMKELLSKTFTGSATGKYDDFEFALFPSTISTASSNPTYYINVVLLFEKKLSFGLEIFHNGIISGLVKLIAPAAYVKIDDNTIFNKLIAVKAKRKDQACAFLSDKELQGRLIKLFEFSRSFNISDSAIRYDKGGTIISKAEALKVMDLMVDVAERFI